MRDNDGEMHMIEPGKQKELMVGRMIAYLEKAREQKHPPKQEPKPKKLKRPSVFRDINLEMQSFIVYLRFESVTEPGPVKRSF